VVPDRWIKHAAHLLPGFNPFRVVPDLPDPGHAFFGLDDHDVETQNAAGQETKIDFVGVPAGRNRNDAAEAEEIQIDVVHTVEFGIQTRGERALWVEIRIHSGGGLDAQLAFSLSVRVFLPYAAVFPPFAVSFPASPVRPVAFPHRDLLGTCWYYQRPRQYASREQNQVQLP